MKVSNFLKIFLITCLVSLFIFASDSGSKAGKEEELAQIYSLFQSGEGFFVDARGYDAYKQLHVEGAISIPFHSEDKLHIISKMEDLLQSVPKIIVYCDGSECNLSKLLAQDLVEFGINKEKIIIFKYGFEQWKKANYPVSNDTSFQESLLN
jgi:rhodanese-related sulfurtransferase